MNVESLRSLQKRIREAKGADRELDRDIANAFRPAGFRGFYTFTSAPLYTADPNGLGPCVALMREVLPGWRRGVHEHSGSCSVAVYAPDGRDYEGAVHAIETHATLLAIVSALIAQEEAKEKAGA